MLKTSFDAALAGARSLVHVDELARVLWRAHAAGALSDDEAQSAAEVLEGRRREIRPKDRTAVRAPHVPRLSASFFPPKRRYPVSPDRHASQQRRRRLAASGPMPPALACNFTTGQLAVLRIVASEVQEKGFCALPLGAIAARAGVCVTTARDAIRAAALDGLVLIEERRQRRAPNLPNIIRIVSLDWMTWIKRGAKGGSKVLESTIRQAFKSSKKGQSPFVKDERQALRQGFRPSDGDRGG